MNLFDLLGVVFVPDPPPEYRPKRTIAQLKEDSPEAWEELWDIIQRYAFQTAKLMNLPPDKALDLFETWINTGYIKLVMDDTKDPEIAVHLAAWTGSGYVVKHPDGNYPLRDGATILQP